MSVRPTPAAISEQTVRGFPPPEVLSPPVLFPPAGHPSQSTTFDRRCPIFGEELVMPLPPTAA